MNDRTCRSDSERFIDPLSDYEPVEYGDALQQVLAEESVPEIQSRPFAEIGSHTPIRQAVHTLQELDVASLMVIDDGQLVGIFTERDVLERVAERYSSVADLPVSEVMTTEPVVVYESDPLGAALAAIAVGGYRHVPLLSMSDEVLGILSPRRVFNMLQQRCGGLA